METREKMTNFMTQVMSLITHNKSQTNDGMQRYYQAEYPRIEGERLYAEFLRSGRVR
jgi:hypothetical protein